MVEHSRPLTRKIAATDQEGYVNPTPITSISPATHGRILAQIRAHSAPQSNGCIEWVGPKDRHGYGKIKISVDSSRRWTGTHRAAWLAQRGPIPQDMVIDHLCRNRACANVEHMEVVTVSLNTARGDHSNKKGRSGRVAGSPPGCSLHGQSDGYAHLANDGYERWVCRTCRKAASARYKARRRQLAG